MSKSGFIQKLEKLEDKYGFRACIHEWIDCGWGSITLYRVIEKEEERKEPLPIEMQEEISALLIKQYRSWWKGFLESVRIKLGLSPSWFCFSVAIEGLTVDEINERQASWNRYANDFNEACD